MTTYREDIYPAHLETARGDIFVFSNGVPLASEMPVIVFAWWDLNNRIVAMSHQGLQ